MGLLINPESENALIGLLLLEPARFSGLVIPPEAFTLPHTHAAWVAMTRLSARGTFDYPAVRQEAQNVTGAPVGPDLDLAMAAAISTVELEYHVKSVLDAYRARCVVRMMRESIDAIESGTEPVIAFNEAVSKGINLVARCDKGPRSARGVVANQISALAKLREGGMLGIPTGFPRLDAVTHGLMPGNLYCLSAYQAGGGKTSLAMQIASQVAERQDGSVLVFSAELSEQTLFMREVSRRSGLSVSEIIAADPEAITPAIEAFVNSRLIIDTTEMPSIEHIQAHTLAEAARGKLSLVVVDMIQHIDAPGRDEWARIENAVKGLWALTKRAGVPLVCVSSVNRTTDGNGLPTMKNLYGSSWIDSLASYVGILVPAKLYYERKRADHAVDAGNGKRVFPEWGQFWRAERLQPPAAENGRVLVSLKNRHGPQWNIAFNSDGARFGFSELGTYDEWLAATGIRTQTD